MSTNNAVQTVGEKKKQDLSVSGQPDHSDASSLMTIIERISTMPDLDLDRVERLFDMHQKMIDRQQEQAFNNAMAQAQNDIQSVVVNKINKHTGSSYADIDAIHEEAKPVWTGHGFSILTRTGSSELQGHVKIFCEVRHSGGHKECYEDDWPLDTSGAQGTKNKTAIQGKGSTITYARRYTELMIFDIATKGEDKDGSGSQRGSAANKTLTPGQIANLQKAISVAGITEEQFCAHKSIKVNRLAELPQARLKGALAFLESRAKGDQQ